MPKLTIKSGLSQDFNLGGHLLIFVLACQIKLTLITSFRHSFCHLHLETSFEQQTLWLMSLTCSLDFLVSPLHEILPDEEVFGALLNLFSYWGCSLFSHDYQFSVSAELMQNSTTNQCTYAKGFITYHFNVLLKAVSILTDTSLFLYDSEKITTMRKRAIVNNKTPLGMCLFGTWEKLVQGAQEMDMPILISPSTRVQITPSPQSYFMLNEVPKLFFY